MQLTVCRVFRGSLELPVSVTLSDPDGSSIGPAGQFVGNVRHRPNHGSARGLNAQLETPCALAFAARTRRRTRSLPISRDAHYFADVPRIAEALRTSFRIRRAPAVKFVNYRMPQHWRVQFHVTAIKT